MHYLARKMIAESIFTLSEFAAEMATIVAFHQALDVQS
jgi:hypothetical protein